MPEEIKKTEESNNESAKKSLDEIDVIKKLQEDNNELKNKLKEEADKKSKLLNDVLNGGGISDNNKKDEKPLDLNELRRNLISNPRSLNIEVVSNALKLRDEVIARGEMDPFLPGRDATEADREIANNVASVFQQCIDAAKGDSGVFTAELMRRTIDVGPIIKKKR